MIDGIDRVEAVQNAQEKPPSRTDNYSNGRSETLGRALSLQTGFSAGESPAWILGRMSVMSLALFIIRLNVVIVSVVAPDISRRQH